MPDNEGPEQVKDKHVPDKKKQDKLGKYKWYVIAGLAAIAALVFFFTSKSNQNANAGQTSQSNSPAMTVPPGGGFIGRPGPRGPAGPAGQRGQRGQRGRRGRRGR